MARPIEIDVIYGVKVVKDNGKRPFVPVINKQVMWRLANKDIRKAFNAARSFAEEVALHNLRKGDKVQIKQYGSLPLADAVIEKGRIASCFGSQP